MGWKILRSRRSLSQNNKNRETASEGLIESLFSKQITLSNKYLLIPTDSIRLLKTTLLSRRSIKKDILRLEHKLKMK